jgi:isopenicillin N synthase-like dioxygenase
MCTMATQLNRQCPYSSHDITIVDQIFKTGFAKIKLGVNEYHTISHLMEQARTFFVQDEAIKRLHSCPEFHFGFRPFGRQYSSSPDRLDMNESFTYWSDDHSLIPGHETIGGFTSALHSGWKVIFDLASSLMADIARRFTYPRHIDLKRASYIEVNWYLCDDSRDLLQYRHEDGHFLTLVTADGPGLEIELDGAMAPVEFAPDEVFVMTGSLLTAMTGGGIPPLYHQVRNHHCPMRCAILLLLNPPFDEPIEPFVRNDQNKKLDIAALAQTNGKEFGLPVAPILPSALT